MPGSPYILEETTWTTVRKTAYELAVLPWGATEAHNRHLPYGTDSHQSRAVAQEAARRAWDAGVRLVVLPTVPLGVQSGQLDIPLCLHARPSTQAAVLLDVARSVERAGVRKLVILNGHGGNEFRGMVRELQPDLDVLLCAVDWYACVDPAAHFNEPGDHAGELETSVMMHVKPELVGPLEDAGPGRARSFRIRGLREGWAWTPRQWTEVTDDTGVGDPARATPERGGAFFRAVTERIGEFLVEVADADPEDLYA